MLLLLAQDPQDEIRRLIEQLGADDVEAREKATRGLLDQGLEARPALETASKGSDPEVAERALWVLRCFAVVDKIPLEILRADPQVLGAWESGRWIAVVDRWKNRPVTTVSIRYTDLVAVAGNALKGELADVDRVALLELVGQFEMRDVAPQMVPFFGSAHDETRKASFKAYVKAMGHDAAPVLKELLSRDSGDLRAAAAEAAGEWGLSELWPALVRLLEKGSADERWRAATALGRMEQEECIPRIQGLLDSTDADVRRNAVRILADLNVCEAAPWLRESLSDPEVRNAAADALAKFKDAEAVTPLLELLASEDAEDRAFAVVALGKFRDPRIGEALLGRLEDDEPSVRIASATALADVGYVKAGPRILGLLDEAHTDIQPYFIRALGDLRCAEAESKLLELLEDVNDEILRATLEAIGEIGVQGAIDRIVGFVREDSPSRSQEAWGALRRLSPARAIKEAVRVVESFGSMTPQFKAAEQVLLPSETEGIQEALAALLNHQNEELRFLAIRAFWAVLPEIYVRDVMDRIDDGSARNRRAAITALGLNKIREAVPRLGELLSDKDPSIRRAAAIALGRMESGVDGEVLLPLLNDERPSVRSVGAEALGNLGVSKAIPELIRLLDDGAVEEIYPGYTGPSVRDRAAYALGKLRAADAAERIASQLGCADVAYRRTAAHALGRLERAAVVPEVRRLLVDGRIRFEALEALARLGDRTAAAPLLEWAGSGLLGRSSWALESLCWLRWPDAMKEISKRKVAFKRQEECSFGAVLERWEEETGMVVRLGEGFTRDLREKRVYPSGMVYLDRSAAGLLGGILYECDGSASFASEVVTITPRKTALPDWRRWVGGLK